MAFSRTELLQMFKKTAAEIAEKDFPNISEATVISELGIDSLGMLEIVGAMERQLKIQIPDESLAGIQTVCPDAARVQGLGPAGSPPPPSEVPTLTCATTRLLVGSISTSCAGPRIDTQMRPCVAATGLGLGPTTKVCSTTPAGLTRTRPDTPIVAQTDLLAKAMPDAPQPCELKTPRPGCYPRPHAHSTRWGQPALRRS